MIPFSTVADANAVLHTGADHSDEALLAVDAIQGNILPGFGVAHEMMIGLRIEDPQLARQWLRGLAPLITTLRQAQQVREVRRAVARATGSRPLLPDLLVNVALSFPALELLGLASANIDDGPFRQGLMAAGLDHDALAPANWRVGGTSGTVPHILLIAGSDALEQLDTMPAASHLQAHGLREIYRERGDRLPGDIEHFGFRDGISQPGVRGRLSERPDHVLTRRYLDPSDPRYQSHSRPGQELLWPGQFVFGYPTQLETGPEPGPLAEPPEPWMADGAFLVFLRLRQHVEMLQSFAREQAALISQKLQRAVSPEQFLAWVVGRWPDGTPLVRSPLQADPAIACDDNLVDFFQFALPEQYPDAVVRDGTQVRHVPGVAGDPSGVRCPFFAHIRKVNLRDKPTDQGPSERFRILRRGIPYGPVYKPGESSEPDRGLLFVSYQRSLDPQFTTLVATWMNSHDAPEGGGHDLLLGRNRSGRHAEIRDEAGQVVHTVRVDPNRNWVTLTGGGFFFAPSVRVLGAL